MPDKPLPPIRACLFDMDGLLINTEDLYTVAINQILASFGKPPMPYSLKAKLQGLPAKDANLVFLKETGLPLTRDEFRARELEIFKDLFPTARPLPGVTKLLDTLTGLTGNGNGNDIEIALATSANRETFAWKTDHLRKQIFDLFKPEQTVLGDDPRIEGPGKPAPGIYLLALRTINDRLALEGKPQISPEECLVFEDGIPGVEAGRRAGMRVVWVPHPLIFDAVKDREARIMAGVDGENKAEDTDCPPEKGGGRTGRVGDGKTVRLASLEDFDYSAYGIKI